MSDGVEVVMDLYDLKEGHDKFRFMERMVSDPAITHVLVMSDKVYSEKADAKQAGVGTESQIISSEVYAKTEQSKFIPIVCERSDDNEPFLPVFLKSRIWIDFSSLESINRNWEALIRLLYGKPVYIKPALGKSPSYLEVSSSAPASPAAGKLDSLKQALASSVKNLDRYREDFLMTCFELANSLRVRENPGTDPVALGQKILEDSGKLAAIRNLIVDWVVIESSTSTGEDFEDVLHAFLESLLELKSRPEEINSWADTWFEAHSVFVYETFLYIVSALIKTKSCSLLRQVLSSHYLRPKHERYGETLFENFGAFYGYSEVLQSALGVPGKRLYSPAAALIKQQANRTDLTFQSVMEAELIVFLMALISPDIRWYPQTLFYYSRTDFPFFIKATRHRDFLKLATITGVPTGDKLRDAVKAGYERLGVNQWHDFFMMNGSFWTFMNIEKLDSLQ